MKKCYVAFCLGISWFLILQASEDEPSPVQEEAGQVEQLEWQPVPAEDEGLTTTDYDLRGNWAIKREILNHARNLYEKVRDTVILIDGSKKEFIEQKAVTEPEVGKFYSDIGFEQGAIDKHIEVVTREFEEKSQADQKIDEDEKRILAELAEKKNELLQLKNDISILQELQATLQKGLQTAIEQIDISRSFEQKSWENYEKIAEVLNDEIAERLYYEMQGFKANIESIGNYLNQELRPFFDQTNAKIKEQMGVLKKRIDDLRARGVILDQKIEQFEAERPEVKKEEIKPVSWYQWLFNMLLSPFVYVYDAITSSFNWFYGLIFGVEEPKKAPQMPAGLVPVTLPPTVPVAPTIPALQPGATEEPTMLEQQPVAVPVAMEPSAIEPAAEPTLTPGAETVEPAAPAPQEQVSEPVPTEPAVAEPSQAPVEVAIQPIQAPTEPATPVMAEPQPEQPAEPTVSTEPAITKEEESVGPQAIPETEVLPEAAEPGVTEEKATE